MVSDRIFARPDTFAYMPEAFEVVIETDDAIFPRTVTFAPVAPMLIVSIERVFRDVMFMRAAVTFVVAIAFDTNTFPETSSAFPVGPVPTPVFVSTSTGFTAVIVPVLLETVVQISSVLKAFETYAFPSRYTAVPEFVVVPTPTKPETDETFRVWTFPETDPKTFVVVTEFETKTFPWTPSVFPEVPVPIPTFVTTVRLMRFDTAETFRVSTTALAVATDLDA
jgi:hypothetical protein